MPDFRKVFDSIQNQVLIDNAHLALWKGLAKRLSGPRNVVASTAPTFFGMTVEAHLSAAFLHAGRVYDTHPDSVTTHTVINKARQDATISR